MCRRQIHNFVPVSGGDHIREHNQHFGPAAACSLEGRGELALATHWQEQEFKAKFSAPGFDRADGIICPRVGRVPENSYSGKIRESFFEQRQPLAAELLNLE